jgi:integrase
MNRIDTKRGRLGLIPRREPYWYKLSRERHLGLRKLSASSEGSWIARLRDESGLRRYKALGECTGSCDFDAAKLAAEGWFKDCERGVTDRPNGETYTVASACIAYIRALRREGRLSTAHDAHKRFRRTVYGATADAEFESAPVGSDTDASGIETSAAVPASERPAIALHRKAVKPHPIASVPLAKVRAVRIRDWHLGLTADKLSKSSANRTLSALKAALNLAVRNRCVSALVAQEWAEVQPLKHASRRRDLFLDVEQRRALMERTQGSFRDLLAAAAYTGCRAGELTHARRSAFDARTGSLSVTGKTGARSFPLAPGAVEFFTRLSKDKLPQAYLLTRDDGRPWAHSDWDELVKEAAQAAGLPKETCLYTLRHSFITQALLDGMSTLEVAKMVGTSLAMIEKHYGHLVFSTARERLAKVQLV